MEQRALNISPTILIEEISKLIRSLLNGKALGPDGIPNKVLKMVTPVIIKDLVKAASHYFANGTILESLKESITVVLRKEGKKNYSLLGSYRPIALKNTLVKVLEKYIANIILEAAEEHGLLFWNQIGARRKRLMLLAVGLLSSCVQIAWRTRRGYVVLMLSLDLVGAFNNISYKRLLYILKRKGFLKWLTDFI